MNLRNIIRKIDAFISGIYFSELQIKPLHTVVSKPFCATPVNHLPDVAIKSFLYYNNIEQLEYYYKLIGNYFIEPFNGWIFDSQKKHYLTNSVPYSFLAGKPSFYQIKVKKTSVIKLSKVISIRYNFQNYWHFLNDVLGQIAIIDKNEAEKDIPILVPAGVLQMPFVKAAIDYSPKLKSKTWIEHRHGTLINADCVIVAKNIPNTKYNFLSVLNMLCINVGTHFYKQSEKKIFITRKNTSSRLLQNSEEIESLVSQYGFDVVDNSILTIQEQILLYQSCETVIAIHGAGLTNMIFRYPQGLNVIELFPEESIFPHYYWLSNQLGFTYNCIIGGKTNNNEFYLDPIKLKLMIS